MEQLVEIRLRDGATILAEVEPGTPVVTPSGGRAPVSIGSDMLKHADFGETMRSVQLAASEVADSLRKMATPPDACEVTFGIKLSATGSAILAKMSGDVNFSVTLKWTSKPSA